MNQKDAPHSPIVLLYCGLFNDQFYEAVIERDQANVVARQEYDREKVALLKHAHTVSKHLAEELVFTTIAPARGIYGPMGMPSSFFASCNANA
jgi:hypothetical protein